MYQSMSVLLHLGKSPTSEFLRVECFKSPLDISSELCVPSTSFSSPYSIQVIGRMCHSSVQASNSSSTFLHGDSLVSHISQHVGRHSLSVSHCKGPHHGCLCQPGAQGSEITVFNPLATQRCVLSRQGFSSSVSYTVEGQQVSMTQVYQQFWKEWTRCCA